MPKILELCAVDITVKDLLLPLIDKLEKEGYEVEIACSRGEVTETLEKKGYVFKFVNIDRKLSFFSNIKSIVEIYKIARKGKYDIVHVHTPAAGILGRVAAKLAATPLIIYTAHGFYFHEGMSRAKYNIVLKIEKYLAKYFTDFIFTQSEEDRKTALENHFIDKNKILTISNGVDIQGSFNPINIERDEIDELYKEFNLERNDKIITFIGRLVQEKGVMDLLKAFNGANFNDEAKVKLLIVGDIEQSERDRDTIKKLEKYSDNPNVIFAGHRDDVNSILYITDVFCLPSYREGMPRSIIEAMAMECAVVATDIRGSREEVIDGKTGFLVPVNSINNLSDKIKELVEDEKLLKKMKNAGRRRAEKLFDEKEVIEKQLEIFSRLLNPKKKILFIATVENNLICFHIPYMKYLQDKGYEIYAATKLGERKGKLEQYGIICRNVAFSRLANPFISLKALIQLINLMRKNQFSLIHVHTPMAAFLGRLAAKFTHQRPVLYTAHGFHFYKGAPWYYWTFIYPVEFFMARWQDGLIVINHEDFNIAQKMPIRNKGKVYLIPGIGVDMKRYKPIPEEQRIFLRKKHGFKNKDFLLIYTAELNKNKNQYFLIKAMSFLKDKIPNLKILFAGDGNMKDDYEKYVQSLNLKDNIVFLGYRQDLEKIIPMCDIGTSASIREGFGINLVEYMSVGLPVVATKNRGHKEIIVDGSNGLLFELGNMTQFIEAIERLYKYKSLRKKLGKNAIKSIKKYSIERSLNVVSEIYDSFV